VRAPGTAAGKDLLGRRDRLSALPPHPIQEKSSTETAPTSARAVSAYKVNCFHFDNLLSITSATRFTFCL
jgi:hypothetical protein